MKVLIIILCIVAYLVIGTFCIAKTVEDFMGVPIDFKKDAFLLGWFTMIWPLFILLYLLSRIVRFLYFKKK